MNNKEEIIRLLELIRSDADGKISTALTAHVNDFDFLQCLFDLFVERPDLVDVISVIIKTPIDLCFKSGDYDDVIIQRYFETCLNSEISPYAQINLGYAVLPLCSSPYYNTLFEFAFTLLSGDCNITGFTIISLLFAALPNSTNLISLYLL